MRYMIYSRTDSYLDTYVFLNVHFGVPCTCDLTYGTFTLLYRMTTVARRARPVSSTPWRPCLPWCGRRPQAWPPGTTDCSTATTSRLWHWRVSRRRTTSPRTSALWHSKTAVLFTLFWFNTIPFPVPCWKTKFPKRPWVYHEIAFQICMRKSLLYSTGTEYKVSPWQIYKLGLNFNPFHPFWHKIRAWRPYFGNCWQHFETYISLPYFIVLPTKV